jgi:hypothetical protein
MATLGPDDLLLVVWLCGAARSRHAPAREAGWGSDLSGTHENGPTVPDCVWRVGGRNRNLRRVDLVPTMRLYGAADRRDMDVLRANGPFQPAAGVAPDRSYRRMIGEIADRRIAGLQKAASWVVRRRGDPIVSHRRVIARQSCISAILARCCFLAAPWRLRAPRGAILISERR